MGEQIEQPQTQDQDGSTKTVHNGWYILSAIFFIICIYFLFSANGYMKEGGIFTGNYHYMYKQYVGGDAFNYIIASGYATVITMRAVLFAVLSTGSCIAGIISNK